MGSQNLRWAGRADIGAILDLLEAYHRQEGLRRPSRERLKGLLEDMLDNPTRSKILLAELGGEIVGYAVLVRRYSLEYASELAVIDEIFVAGKARERGLGRRMITYCEEYAASEGMPAITLEVSARNVNAEEFYRAVGFSRIDRHIYARDIRGPR